MAGEPEVQVSRLLDERGWSPFQVRLLIWAILLSLIDGYDIGAMPLPRRTLSPRGA